MKTLNKIQLIGNLGMEPQIHTFPDGNIVANLSIATESGWQNKKKEDNDNDLKKQDSKDQKNQKNKEKDKKKLKLNLKLKKDKSVNGNSKQQDDQKNGSNERNEKTKKADWHKIVCYGRLAEIASSYLHCGSKIYVEGYLKHKVWENEEGQKQYSTEVVAQELIIFSPFKNNEKGVKYGKNSKDKIKNLKIKNSDSDMDEDMDDEEIEEDETYEEDDEYEEDDDE